MAVLFAVSGSGPAGPRQPQSHTPSEAAKPAQGRLALSTAAARGGQLARARVQVFSVIVVEVVFVGALWAQAGLERQDLHP